MGRGLEVARQALLRQAKQSVIAVGVAILVLLALAPLTVLTQAAVPFAREHGVPLDEVTLVMALAVLVFPVHEMCTVVMMGGVPRYSVVAGVMLVQALAWVAVMAIAMALGAEQTTAAGILIASLIMFIGNPIVALLLPANACEQRLRRAVRQMQNAPVRMLALVLSLVTILYVYLTVSTDLRPEIEVLVMGCAMPTAQALLLVLLARLAGRKERVVRHVRMVTQRKMGLSNNSFEAHRKASTPLVMALCAKTIYSAGAFAVLVLAETDATFLSSLLAMVAIEIVQVGVHVRARRMIYRVMAEGAADTLIGDDARLLQWLLHQELGEKIGTLIALGVVLIEKAVGRDIPSLNAVNHTQLAMRGAAVILFSLVGDLGKDLVTQALGLVSAGDRTVERAAMSRIGFACAVAVGINSGLIIQCGLALSTPA